MGEGLCFIDYAKAFDCMDHNKLWKILEEMEIPDHLTCLLINLYAGQEVTVQTGFRQGRGTRDQIAFVLRCALHTFFWTIDIINNLLGTSLSVQ